MLTPGRYGDALRADALLACFCPAEAGHVVADAAYDSDAIRDGMRRMGFGASIKPNPTHKPKTAATEGGPGTGM